jgi:hypothetical protein
MPEIKQCMARRAAALAGRYGAADRLISVSFLVTVPPTLILSSFTIDGSFFNNLVFLGSDEYLPSALRPAASSWPAARRLPAEFTDPRDSGAG